MLAPNSILQNRYRVVRRLGEGGMGTVYEAIDQRVSCVVALKETFADNDAFSRNAFEREAALLANLRHASLPKVMDYFCENNSEFLVMEFIPGHDLAELLELRGGPFSQDEIFRWADDLLKVLEHLHGLQPPILHRDVKPANLKLTKQGEIFLLDFGLAKGAAGQMPTLLTSKSVRGYTPVYSPLEQIHGEGTDERSDLYALGATMYHLATGRAPVDAPKRFSAIDDNLPDPLRSAKDVNSALSQSLSDVIRQAMGVRRRDRFTNATAMRAALQLALKTYEDSVENTERSADRAAELKRQGDLRRQAEMKVAQQEEAKRAQQALEKVREAEARDRIQREEERGRFEERRAQNEKQSSLTKDQPETIAKKPEPIKTIRAAYPDLKPISTLKSSPNEDVVPAVTQRAPIDIIFSQTSPEPSNTEFNQNDAVEESPSEKGFIVEANSRRNLVLILASILIVGVIGVGIILIWWFASRGPGQPIAKNNESVVQPASTPANGPSLQPIVAPEHMAYVPGGEFVMGRDDGDDYERPAHQVKVKPFFIDIDEVTNQQYQNFVNKTGHAAPKTWTSKHFQPGTAERPVTDVNWDDANAFAKWSKMRLPSEAEWEFAAKGTDGRRYPWGNDWQTDQVNAGKIRSETVNVGKYKGASPFGVLDMSGNAWEWTADKLEVYPGGKLPKESGGVEMRVIRGGSFETDQNSATTTFRRGYPARGDYDYSRTGFRCAKDVN